MIESQCSLGSGGKPLNPRALHSRVSRHSIFNNIDQLKVLRIRKRGTLAITFTVPLKLSDEHC